MSRETIAILDFGSQYLQLIARRVRENQVHSLVFAPGVTPDELRRHGVIGIIMSGGPASAYSGAAPKPDPGIFDLGIPILGICYGMQVACAGHGGCVEAVDRREYGRARLRITGDDSFVRHLPAESNVWMSHADVVTGLGDDFVVLAKTANCPNAIVRHRSRALYGVQFHPEVTHTPEGGQLLRNFLYEICGATGLWNPGVIVDELIAKIREQVRDDSRVICGLSGGVDSSVTAALLHRAIPGRVTPIFVDNGLLRAEERTRVRAVFEGHFKMDLHVVDAAERFLTRLAGVNRRTNCAGTA